MTTFESVLLAVVFFGVAVLYSSVGNAGASGYLAVMALAGMAPDVMKPTALLLNIIVSAIATVRFQRAGYFSWKIFWPFTLGSVPFALVGGAVTVPGPLYSALVGLFLLVAAYRLWFYAGPARRARRPLSLAAALLCGAGVGFLSGLTGIGGGILLSPLLLLAGWADARQSAGVASAFVLVNSVAASLGHVLVIGAAPRAIVLWGLAVALGGLVGAELGARQLAEAALRRVLAVVLAIAGLKLLLVRS
jgi:uncharacterized membrane protein YfcA